MAGLRLFGREGDPRIELVCRRHEVRNVVGPLVTRLDNVWACCRAYAREDHDWVRIRPASLDDVMWAGAVEELQRT